jgi:predicted RNA-binding Zn-ribbon protein involved in translation (DUF1610 family)
MKLKSEGVCKFCNKTFSSTAISRHLQICKKRKKIQEKEEKKWKIFLLRAQAGPFFVFFETKASSTLKDVDKFLRNLWLECCGHLSAFTINNIRYELETEGVDSFWSDLFGRAKPIKTMNSKLYSVLTPGMKFIHEYDFGSTTELDMTFISERKGNLNKIDILARNNLPDFVCISCGKSAQAICTQCLDEGLGFLCEKCAKKHECGEDMLLPVVNSPRMGVCGYTGNNDVW